MTSSDGMETDGERTTLHTSANRWQVMMLLLAISCCAIRGRAQDFWQHMGLDSADVETLVAAPDGSIFAGDYHYGTPERIFRSSDGGTSWTESNRGLPHGGALPAFSDSVNAVYAIGDTTVHRIRHGDTSWTKILRPYHPLAMTGNSTGLMIVGDYGGWIYRSTDYGDSWTKVYQAFDPGNPGNGSIASLAHSATGKIIGSVTRLKGSQWIIRSTDRGLTWVTYYTGFNRYLFTMTVSAVTGSVMGIDGWRADVFRSTDEGVTWTIRDSSQTIRAILFDPSGKLYACGNGWVRVSSDEGLSWVDISHNFPSTASATALAVGFDGHLYVGTIGYGVWKSAQKITDVAGGHYANPPAQFDLQQNYPNPFNPSTTIRYELPKSSMVRLSVYDMLGREVSVLVNERRNAGVHEVGFDAGGLSSGVYFYRLQAGDYVATKRLVIVR